MRLILATVLFVGLALGRSSGYTTKYDNIDIDEILRNTRLTDKYVDCLLEDGSKDQCTPDGKELKDSLPDALKTGCSKCNEKQRAGAEKVIKFLIEKRRPVFDKLAAKYDPEGVYLKKYKEEAEKRGIKL